MLTLSPSDFQSAYIYWQCNRDGRKAPHDFYIAHSYVRDNFVKIFESPDSSFVQEGPYGENIVTYSVSTPALSWSYYTLEINNKIDVTIEFCANIQFRSLRSLPDTKIVAISHIIKQDEILLPYSIIESDALTKFYKSSGLRSEIVDNYLLL